MQNSADCSNGKLWKRYSDTHNTIITSTFHNSLQVFRGEIQMKIGFVDSCFAFYQNFQIMFIHILHWHFIHPIFSNDGSPKINIFCVNNVVFSLFNVKASGSLCKFSPDSTSVSLNIIKASPLWNNCHSVSFLFRRGFKGDGIEKELYDKDEKKFFKYQTRFATIICPVWEVIAYNKTGKWD